MFTNETTSFILRCVRKTIWMLLVLWGITLVSFFVIHLAPGTPTDMQTTLNPLAGEAARARLEALYGIDRPLYIQYFDWLSRIVQLDFGNSMSSDARPVIEKIAERLPLIMRSSMLEVLRQDFILTAKAKGLPARVVIFRHALRNALLPVITLLGLSVPGLIGGSVIIETIFALPGLGQLFYAAVMARDYPLIMGNLVLGAVLTLAGNMLADIGYGLADPRIRAQGKRQ